MQDKDKLEGGELTKTSEGDMSGSGVNMKAVSLIALVVQASASALIMRYSRTIPGPPYVVATAVFFTELFKFLVCCVLVSREELPKGKPTAAAVQEKIIGIIKTSPPYAVPAVLYVIQQYLLIVGVSYLDAVSYQICNQMKVVPTALFSVWLLSRTLTSQQWLSLPVMAIGVAIVTVANSGGESLVDKQSSSHEYLLGLAACMAASFSSGFASVYFEKHVKGGSSTSLWVKNIQLGIYGLSVAGFSMLGSKAVIMEHGLFYGFHWAAWGVVLMQGVGGLLVALVVKYADNILKGFANSVSVILSFLLSIPIFGLWPKPMFFAGLALVLLSISMYNHALGEAAALWSKLPRGRKMVAAAAVAVGVVCVVAGFYHSQLAPEVGVVPVDVVVGAGAVAEHHHHEHPHNHLEHGGRRGRAGRALL